MKPKLKTMTLAAIMAAVLGGILVLAVAGGDGNSRPAAASAGVGKPLEVTLAPAHRSGVSGTARLVPGPDGIEVTVKLSKRVTATLPAHIHTGPCSDEPTLRNPRIWAALTDLSGGRSETTVNVVTLPELQAETSSINVHDPRHDLRPLVCGDIPRSRP